VRPVPFTQQTVTQIRYHVVILMQEKRSFDRYFGTSSPLYQKGMALDSEGRSKMSAGRVWGSLWMPWPIRFRFRGTGGPI
jgi:hypothetical protein